MKTMLFIGSKHKSFLIVILGTLLIVLSVAVLYWWQRGDTLLVQPSSDYKSVAELRDELNRVSQYEFENGCVEVNDRGMEVFCGESKERVEALEAQYQAAVQAEQTPDPQTQESDIRAIRGFMGDQTLKLAYTNSRSPSNFNLGVVTPLSNEGDARLETPEEWRRKVNVYVTTEEIDDTCEIYEYEVYPKTHDVVQVHVVYPEGYSGQCNKGNLFSSEVSEQEIRMYGEKYLSRANPKNINETTGDIDDGYTITELSRGDTSRWEWKWEDDIYQLPEGMSGSSAVDSRPTIRLHISNGGKLLQYNNTIPLFNN